MAIPVKTLRLLRARDPHCWHCGLEDDLVPHHRINRGMGGSKLLDTLDNLMLVCGLYNGAMESDLLVARDARGWGRKLAAWEDTCRPVFDSVSHRWWILLPDGSRVEHEVKDSF